MNELNIPILCMGCKDMIIAASGDGILIADKERSGYMKPYVEKIETEAMYAEKSWGSYTVIDVQPGSMTVKISMRAGEHMTYHMHHRYTATGQGRENCGAHQYPTHQKRNADADIHWIHPAERCLWNLCAHSGSSGCSRCHSRRRL